jgi:hypothetical protein
MRVYKNLDTLKKAIAKKEVTLKEEQDRTTQSFINLGWGAGMRRSKLGCSYTKEDKLREQLREMYLREEELENERF